MLAHAYTHAHPLTHTYMHARTHTRTHTHTQCGFFRRKKKPVHEGTSNEPETDPHQEDSKLTDSDHENIALQETHTQAGQVQHFELDTKENNTVDRKNDTSTDDQLDNTTHGDSQAHGDDDALDKPDQSH